MIFNGSPLFVSTAWERSYIKETALLLLSDFMVKEDTQPEEVMSARIHSLWRYWMKGARGTPVDELSVDAKIGIVGDRRFGLRRQAGQSDWAKKSEFFVAMNTPQMAAEMPEYERAVDGAEAHVTGPPSADYLEGLRKRVAEDGEFFLQDTGGAFTLCDTKGAFVSWINLETVRELLKFAGRPTLDGEVFKLAERFRMTVWITGLPPFIELSLADVFPGNTRIIETRRDDATLEHRVDDACERCAAITADPVFAKRDRDQWVMTELVRMMTARGSPHRGKPAVMGILTAPRQSGILRVGDEIVF